MKIKNKHKQKVIKAKPLEGAAEAWTRLCLFHIQQKHQNQNKKASYEYSK